MSLIIKGIKQILTPRVFVHKFKGVILEKFAPLIPDVLFIKLKWKHVMGYPLNLESPKTFNEKLQWLKLYDRRPTYTQMVDKYEVKKYVSDLIGEEYIIPTIGVWNKTEEIEWDKLPNQFVLKCTHDSGGIVICKDKQKMIPTLALKKLEEGLNKNFYYQNREWPYKNVKPRIIAEQYMEDETGELRDFKFFCFNGVVKALFIATDRTKDGETRFDFYDDQFKHLPFTNGHPNADVTPSKPVCFEKMKELASILSKGIPQVRIDFYEIRGKVYFGEITFFHWSGMVPFVPKEWDLKFGELIQLPRN